MKYGTTTKNTLHAPLIICLIKRWFVGTHLFLLSKLHILSFTENSCVYHQFFAIQMHQSTGIATTDPFRSNRKTSVAIWVHSMVITMNPF